MISPRGMYMHNIADIILSMRYICNADINKLGDISHVDLEIYLKIKKSY